MMGDLDDFLHIGINAEKSTQIGEFCINSMERCPGNILCIFIAFNSNKC